MRRGSARCAEAARLGRTATASADFALLVHLRQCTICRAEWAALEGLSALATALPAPAGRTTRRELARARLVASATSVPPQSAAPAPAARPDPLRAPRRVATALGIASALAAAAGAVLVASGARVDRDGPQAVAATQRPPAFAAAPAIAPGPGPSPAIAHRGAVEPRGHARFTWSELPDEVVRLAEGEISVRVSPLGAHERFRVVCRDAEVEVRGTAFDVAAAGGRLASVAVTHGLVVVRPAAGEPVLLGPGQEWHAPEDQTRTPGRVADLRRAPAGEAHLRPRRHATPPALPGAAERAFAEGWRALRVGDYVDAAAAFDRAAAAGPGEVLAEDALYWRAVAQARAGHAAEARAAMVSFLDEHPTSERAGEIAAMLGWLLFDFREDQAAARAFTTATRDRAAKVRASAEAGLAALARRSAGSPP
jgi:hypothetical protein